MMMMASTSFAEPGVAPEPFRLRSSLLLHVSAIERRLDQVLMDHTYAAAWNYHPGASNAQPAKMLFVPKTLRMPRSGRAHSPGSSNTNVVVDVDEGSPTPPVPYDSNRARQVMNECDRHVSFVRTNPKEEKNDEDWEEKLDRTGWTPSQSKLFNKILKNLQADRLSKLACEGTANEPVIRRIYVDKCAKMVRRTLASVGWEPDLMQWLHKTLVQNLGNSLLGSYLNVLQTLRSKVPTLIDKMTASSRLNSTSKEALDLLLKRPWDPAVGLLSQHKPKKLPKSPVLLVAPQGPFQQSLSGSRRTRFWFSQLSGIAKVVPVTMADDCDTDTLLYLDAMIAAVKEKICEVRDQNPSRPIILIGWSIGALIATQISLEEALAGIICVGFPSRGLNGYRGDIDEPLFQCKTPCLFVIGQESSICNQDDIESIRERMPAVTGMVVVGGADERLRMSKRKKKMEGLTQSMVDRCIIDEIGDFLGKVLDPELLIQTTTTSYLDLPTKRKYIKTKERKEEKHKRRAQRDFYIELGTESVSTGTKRRKVSEDMQSLPPSTRKSRKLRSPPVISFDQTGSLMPHKSSRSHSSADVTVLSPSALLKPLKESNAAASLQQETTTQQVPIQSMLIPGEAFPKRPEMGTMLAGISSAVSEQPLSTLPAAALGVISQKPITKQPTMVSKGPISRPVTKTPKAARTVPTKMTYTSTLIHTSVSKSTGETRFPQPAPNIPGMYTSAVRPLSRYSLPKTYSGSQSSPKPPAPQKPKSMLTPGGYNLLGARATPRPETKTQQKTAPPPAVIPGMATAAGLHLGRTHATPASLHPGASKPPQAPQQQSPTTTETDNSFSAQYARFLAQLQNKARSKPSRTKHSSAAEASGKEDGSKVASKRKLSTSPTTIKNKQMRLVSLPIITQELKTNSAPSAPGPSVAPTRADDSSSKASVMVKKVSSLLAGKGAINFERLKVAMNQVTPKLAAGSSLGEASQSLLKTSVGITPSSSSQVFTLQQLGALSRVTPSTSGLLSGLNYDVQRNQQKEAKAGGVQGVLEGLLGKGMVSAPPNQHAFIQALNSTQSQQIRQPRRLSGSKSPKRGDPVQGVAVGASSIKGHSHSAGRPKSPKSAAASQRGQTSPRGSRMNKNPLLPDEVSVQTIQKLQFHDFPLTTAALKPATSAAGIYTQAKILTDLQQGAPLTLSILEDGERKEVGLGPVAPPLKANTTLHTQWKPTPSTAGTSRPSATLGVQSDGDTVTETSPSSSNSKEEMARPDGTETTQPSANTERVDTLSDLVHTPSKETPEISFADVTPEVGLSPTAKNISPGEQDLGETLSPDSEEKDDTASAVSVAKTLLSMAFSGGRDESKSLPPPAEEVSPSVGETESMSTSDNPGSIQARPAANTIICEGTLEKSPTQAVTPACADESGVEASAMISTTDTPEADPSCSKGEPEQDTKITPEASSEDQPLQEADSSFEDVPISELKLMLKPHEEENSSLDDVPISELKNMLKPLQAEDSSLEDVPISELKPTSKPLQEETSSLEDVPISELKPTSKPLQEETSSLEDVPISVLKSMLKTLAGASSMSPPVLAPISSANDKMNPKLSQGVPNVKRSSPPELVSAFDPKEDPTQTSHQAVSEVGPSSGKPLSPVLLSSPNARRTLEVYQSVPDVPSTPVLTPSSPKSSIETSRSDPESPGSTNPPIPEPSVSSPKAKPISTRSSKSFPEAKASSSKAPLPSTKASDADESIIKTKPASKDASLGRTVIKTTFIAMAKPGSGPSKSVPRSRPSFKTIPISIPKSMAEIKSPTKSSPGTLGATSPGTTKSSVEVKSPLSKNSPAGESLRAKSPRARSNSGKSSEVEKPTKGGWKKLTGAARPRRSCTDYKPDNISVPSDNEDQLPTLSRVTSSTRTRKVRAPKQLSDYTELL